MMELTVVIFVRDSYLTITKIVLIEIRTKIDLLCSANTLVMCDSTREKGTK